MKTYGKVLVRATDRVAQDRSIVLLGHQAALLRITQTMENTYNRREVMTIVNGTKDVVVDAINAQVTQRLFRPLMEALTSIDKETLNRHFRPLMEALTALEQESINESMYNVLVETAEEINSYFGKDQYNGSESDENMDSEDDDTDEDKEYKIAEREWREEKNKLRSMIRPKALHHLLQAAREIKELTDTHAPLFPSKETITTLLGGASLSVDNAILAEVDAKHFFNMVVETKNLWRVIARHFNFGGTEFEDVKDAMEVFIGTMKEYLFGEHNNTHQDDEINFWEVNYDGRTMSTEKLLDRLIAKVEGEDFDGEEEEDYSGNISDQDRFDPQAQEEVINQNINVRLSLLQQKKMFEWMNKKELYDEYVCWMAEEADSHRVPFPNQPGEDLPPLYRDGVEDL